MARTTIRTEDVTDSPADSGKYTWNEQTQSWDLIEQKV